MANTNCSVNIPQITSAFISKEGNEILSAIKAPRYVDYINYLFGNVFQREYMDNNSFVRVSDFTDENKKLTLTGNLNNLYREVEKELSSQLNSQATLLLPEQTKKDITEILKNWRLFKDYHSKYNAYILIKPEDFEEKDKNNYDKKGNEHTEFDLLTNELRTAFKFFPKAEITKDLNGKTIAVPVINPSDGLPTRADFENIFKLTLDALKGIKDDDKFLQKLTSEELLYRVPELYFFLKLLSITPETGINNLNNRQRYLYQQFYQAMSRDYIPVESSKVILDGKNLPSHFRYFEAQSNAKKIENSFISNFISNQEENEYVKADNTIDEKNPENSVFGKKRLYSLPAKPEFIDLSSDEINKLSVRKIKSDYKNHFNFLKLLGIEFSDFSLIPDKRVLIDVLNSTQGIYDNLKERLENNKQIYSPVEDLQEQDKYVTKNNKLKIIKSIDSILKNIIKFEGTISKINPTHVTKTASGENQSDITYSNAISIGVSEIVSATSLQDLYTKPSFLKLKYNPLHNNSYFANKVIGKNLTLQLVNYSGHTIVDNEDEYSSDTKNLTDVEKFVADFNNLLGWSTINTPQLEQKSGYFAIKVIDKAANKAVLPFSEVLFTKDFLTESEFDAQVTYYLYGEIERVRSYPKVKSYAPEQYGEYHIFENMISPENEANLLKDKSTNDYKKAESEVLRNLNTYFNEELNRLKNFIKKNNIEDFVSSQILKQSNNLSEDTFKEHEEEFTDGFLRTFIANDFVNNVEFGIYFSGDPLFFKDYHKRLAGLASTGTQKLVTKNIRALYNSDEEQIFWNNFSLRGVLNQFASDKQKVDRRDNSSTFLSAVLQEDIIKQDTEYQKPETIPNYIYSKSLSGQTVSEEQARNDLKIKQIEDEGIKRGDGQGWLNLDAHRELSIEQGTYSPKQDASYRFEALIFKQMLLEDNGQSLSEEETKLLNKLERQIFTEPDKYGLPTLKQTYFGTLTNPSVELDAKIYDKFSLATLLPSTAKNHLELKKLLLAMAKRQITYIKYESGTKGFVRHVFQNIDEIVHEKNELDELQSSLLKLQITPPKMEKSKVKMLTQQVKLLFSGLFDKGTASENIIKLRNNFISDLNNIKEYNRKSTLETLGFKTDENGKIISWDKKKVVDALVSQVNLQKLPTPILEALELDEKGDFVNTIESSGIYQQLLNYITGKLDSKLREFKINGGDFVLISESMFSNSLKYSRLNKNRTVIEDMEVRITMTKEFSKLLNLPDPEHKSEIIGSLPRINELLKDSEFQKKYEKELSIVIARAPVSGLNSQGVGRIVEFFYPTAGNILQLPKEFMHQSGIDFDYDKERGLTPSLSSDGLYISDKNVIEKLRQLDKDYTEFREIYDYYQESIDTEDFGGYEEYSDLKNKILGNDSATKFFEKLFKISVKDIPTKLDEIGDKLDEYFRLMETQQNILSNNSLESVKQSLRAPEAYTEIILPNTDEIVKEIARKNGEETDNTNTLPTGIDVYSYQKNLEVFSTFNNAKAMLGPFALHNVFMELIAPLNIVVGLDYNPDKNGVSQRRVNRLLLPNKDRNVNISAKNDINGYPKQHITSEFITAAVDSTKNPYLANFLLSFDNINIFTYLLALDYTADLATDFISSAIIRKYLDLLGKGIRRDDAIVTIIQQLKPSVAKKDINMANIFKRDIDNIDKDNSELLEKLKYLKTEDSLGDKAMVDNHISLLSNFIAMGEHSREFSNFKNLFKNDTDKTSSLFEISSKEELRKSVIKNEMFSLDDVLAVENNSTITAFRNDDLIASVLKQAFPLMANETVSNSLGNLFNSSKPSLKEVEKRILSQIITNDYVTTLLYSFGKYKDRNFFQYAKDLVVKTMAKDGTVNSTLLERLYKFKQNKEYQSLVKQFPVLDKIFGDVSKKVIINNGVYQSKNGFNIFLNIDSNLPILEKEGYMNQFKQIFEGKDIEVENPLVRTALVNLVKDFFIVNLIQSGFNKTGRSYLEYIPIKFIQELLNPALKQYNWSIKSNEFLSKYLELYKTLFTLSNSKYFYIPKEQRTQIQKRTDLGKYLYIPLEFKSEPATKIASSEQKVSADIPQNLVSGVEAFGTKQEATDEIKAVLGPNPHSIDMIIAGFRTRTTRSVGEMEKYNIKVGDIVRQFGKSADGTTKSVLTKVTAIYPKGTKEYESTWNKEGWTQEGISAIQRFKTGAAAIEFELLKQPQIALNSGIDFQEEQTSGYRNRTIKNASADATIAIAVDFNSAGEKLTKYSVLNQNKKYISIDANTLTVTKERVDKIVEQLNSVNAKTLNIAGNGIYTMKGKYTQQQVDDFTYDLLNQVLNSPNLKTKIESIRSGGQTGFDEAGAKAGIRLGLPTLILAPKGWTFRNISGQDISNEQQFKARFADVKQNELSNKEEINPKPPTNLNDIGFKKQCD